MADLKAIIEGPIRKAYNLMPPGMASDKATVLMLAIGLQESRFQYRKQIGGPAKGFWQFEQGGGVRGVMRHPSTKKTAKLLAGKDERATYLELEHDDVLAAIFARLLLYTDSKPLPEIGEVRQAWDYYLRTWQPGKPHRGTWDALYAQAMEAVTG